MVGLPFVDAHFHLWDLNRIRYPWLSPPFSDDGPNGSVEPIARTYLPADYRSDLDGWRLAGAVHVEAGADPSAALEETRWLQGLADAYGLPDAIVAFASLESPGAERLLEAQAAHHSVRGIRQIVNWHRDPARSYTPRDLTIDPAWQTGFGLLARYGMSFDLQCYPSQMAAMAALIARHPDTIVVVNHAGMPIDDEVNGREVWREGMRALSALPNVGVKLSGFGLAERHWTRESIAPIVLETIEMFGMDRCMFATDIPTDKLFGSVHTHLSAYHAIVAGFSEDERLDLFARNAIRHYRLNLTV
jgi:predicted TIM-barrel fold metal-dependent hydrolase